MEQTQRSMTISDLEMELFYGLDEHDFSCSPETSIGFTTSNSHVSTMFFEELSDIENLDDVIHQMSSEMKNKHIIFYDLIHENNSSSSLTTMESDQQSPSFSSKNSSVEFPHQDMEAHDQSSLLTHLLRAYGEAKGNKEKDLTDILIKSINEKSDPMGSTVQCIAYHLFNKYRDDRDEYLRLRQELSKNYLKVLKVMYESLIDSRLAHFTANSAILESIPHEATALHIVDFDLKEGIQWPPLIEAFSFCNNKTKTSLLKITSIAKEDEEGCSYSFEGAKKRLLAHARQFGVKLQIEEKSLEDLVMNMNGGEWSVFNCMVGLPHMGIRRSRKHVMEFLRVAKQSLIDFPGILTLGCGEICDSYNDRCYASYLDDLLKHYQALFESLAKNFPAYLIEARTTLEILFLAPLMHSVDAWYQDWVDSFGFEMETLFEGRRLSQENIYEAKQMVSARDHHMYEVKVCRDHEMVLQWNGVPLVKVSTWM